MNSANLFCKYFIIVFVILFFSSCYSLLEGANPYSNSYNQKWTVNSQGEKVLSYNRDTPFYLGAPLVIGSKLAEEQNSTEDKRSGYPYNNESAMREGVARGYFELISSRQDLHLGFHAAWQTTPHIELRLGASAFFSNDPYLGLDLSGRYYFFDSKVNPFIGAGGFLGDARSCEMQVNGIEQCEKKFLGLGYLEVGTSFGPLSVFYRSYSMNRAGVSIPARDFLGVGITF